MAGGEDEGIEEREIELQLEIQLDEQRQSLVALDEALASDSSNLDLHSVREELLQSIHEAEEGLLHLKRSRLLQEADAIASKLVGQPTTRETYVDLACSSQPEVDPLVSVQFHVGSKCRFRHSDGHWYNGHIVGLEDGASARVSFMNPTFENMMICKFHLQQRCRFGTNCRLSHGNCISISSLKQYMPTVWQQSFVGSSIWALSNDHSGIWMEVTLEKWDGKLKLAQVLFKDGTCAKVDTESITLSQYAQMSDEDDEEGSSLEETESSEGEDEDFENESSIHGGLGFLQSTISQSGIQTETALFAKWENHTRGIASKMMAGMGYREGMGLGASGQGIVDPIIVKSLPPKQSLDHAVQSDKANESKRDGDKKRSRGGKRKRNKKFAEAARAAKVKSEPESNVFSFINDQLAGQNGNTKNSRNNRRIGSGEERESMKKEDRQSLVAHDHKIKELKLQVVRLEEMMRRNLQNDKVVYEVASRKLTETRRDLSSAEADHASASNAVVSKEKEKRWLKF